LGDRSGEYRVFVGKHEKKDHLEDLGVEKRTILKWILKMLDGGMNWIDQAQDTERWRALVNRVMDFGVP
jgi:hypothetical protein